MQAILVNSKKNIIMVSVTMEQMNSWATIYAHDYLVGANDIGSLGLKASIGSTHYI